MTLIEQMQEKPRVTVRRPGLPDPEGRCVVYWMQRAQRALDNPALELAMRAANELRRPLAVFFGLHPGYPNANLRHYQFLFEGLAETKDRVEALGAAFVFRPFPDHDLIGFCREVGACLVIGDENPMREPEGWRRSAAEKLRVPFWTVDADSIVPTKHFPKEEYAARTIRPKIHRLLPEYLRMEETPRAVVLWREADRPKGAALDRERVLSALPLDRSTQPVSHFKGGTTAGLNLLKTFIGNGLRRYDTARNLPDQPGTSGLSAYLHFGHLGPHTIALAVRDADAPGEAVDAYLEELIVRRELAINYVARNPNYDKLSGCHAWALKSLAERAADKREFLYAERQFESAETHDPLWNAAQKEMAITGRMHGYLRMYWAKKILEWTPSAEEAFDIAVRLNDRYELDGRDPNGYTGIAWAIGGKHDRPWAPARPIFGMIRYMAASGCARKFDVKAYIRRVEMLAGESRQAENEQQDLFQLQ
ncbi:MAG: deoxyribodipyrimidine photo-lyase [Blastocatellia bacterium]|nr:deoxyribodipyrimidine photo-lyase [Blastocatellia bacterium]